MLKSSLAEINKDEEIKERKKMRCNYMPTSHTSLHMVTVLNLYSLRTI